MAFYGYVKECVGVSLVPRFSVVEKEGLFSFEDYAPIVISNGREVEATLE